MITHLTQQDFVVSTWSGGTTTQLAISPKTAVYGDRDFLWRISSATVALETSDFTPLPDYSRFIASLDAPITLTHNGGQPILLQPLALHQFDGGDATSCVGCCTDFNLMVRKGRCSATAIKLAVSGTVQIPAAPTTALFCATGTLTAQGHSLKVGEMVLLEGQPSFSLQGEGVGFLCQITALES